MSTKIKQEKLLEWNDLDLLPLDVTETRTIEGRAFMKYNSSVIQLPEVQELQPRTTSTKGWMWSLRLLQPTPELEKPDHGGESPAGVVRTLSLFHRQRNAFEIHLPRKVLPLLQTLQTSGLKQRRLPGLVGKAKSHAAALDASEQHPSVSGKGAILSVLHAVRPAPSRKVPVLPTAESAREPEENLSQVLSFYPTFTLKDRSTWSPQASRGRAKRRWVFRSLTAIKTLAMTGE